METYFKIIELLFMSICFSSLPTCAFFNNDSLHSRHIRDKQLPVSGLMAYSSHISKKAPELKYPVDVDGDDHGPNIDKGSADVLRKNPSDLSDSVKYEISALSNISASQEHLSKTIGDEEVYPTKQTVFNLRRHSKFRVSPTELGLNSWKALWPPNRPYNKQVHPEKYFVDIRSPEKSPTSANTSIYKILTTRSTRKFSSRRDFLGYRGFKIIGAVVDVDHRPRAEVYRNIIRGREHATHNPILYSTIGYVQPDIEHHSSVKRSVENTIIDKYDKETTTLDSEDKGFTDIGTVKPLRTESDQVRFFQYFDRHDEYEDVTSSMLTTEEPLMKISEAQRDIRRHITEETSSDDLDITTWHDHPYMALYIFEPEGIYCDAAGISAHWLITSAACLLQYVPVPNFGEHPSKESAYVTYCGLRWDQPKRIAYVRNITVHPSYKKGKGPLKEPYNIGVVQIDNSMAACDDWRALALWSHPVSAGSAGTPPAVTVGWRLNRLQWKRCDRTRGCRAKEMTILTAHLVSVYSGKCNYVGVRDNTKEAAINPEESVHCALEICRNQRREQRCAGAGVLLAGGRLLGLWLKERRTGADEVSVEYSTAAWRASEWLRGVALEPPQR